MQAHTRVRHPGQHRPLPGAVSGGSGRARGWTASAGVTLIEVILALTTTAMIASSLSVMVYAVSYGTSTETELRDLVVTGNIVHSRLTTAIENSRMVLAKGTDYIVLWTADTVPNDRVNVSELCRLERNPTTGDLYVYRPPSGLSDETDTDYGLSTTDFDAVTRALKASATLQGKLLAGGVTAMTFTVNNTSIQAATFVGYQVTVNVSGAAYTTIGGTVLRNH